MRSEFEPIPQTILDRIENPQAAELLKTISQCQQCGIKSPCVRYLASLMGYSRQWIHKLLNVLRRAGVLLVTRRRLTRTRNDTNLYRIVGFYPRLQRRLRDHEKKKQIQETPAIGALREENTSLKGQLRKLKEHLAEQIKFYKGYIRRGEQFKWRQARSEREESIRRRAMEGMDLTRIPPEWGGCAPGVTHPARI